MIKLFSLLRNLLKASGIKGWEKIQFSHMFKHGDGCINNLVNRANELQKSTQHNSLESLLDSRVNILKAASLTTDLSKKDTAADALFLVKLLLSNSDIEEEIANKYPKASEQKQPQDSVETTHGEETEEDTHTSPDSSIESTTPSMTPEKKKVDIAQRYKEEFIGVFLQHYKEQSSKNFGSRSDEKWEQFNRKHTTDETFNAIINETLSAIDYEKGSKPGIFHKLTKPKGYTTHKAVTKVLGEEAIGKVKLVASQDKALIKPYLEGQALEFGKEEWDKELALVDAVRRKNN